MCFRLRGIIKFDVLILAKIIVTFVLSMPLLPIRVLLTTFVIFLLFV